LMVIVLVPLLPWATVKVVGEAVSVKFPNGFTVSVIVVVALRLPEVPVIVTVTVPTFAVAIAVRVRMLVEVAGFGLKEAVTPVGSSEVVSATLLENPLLGVMVMVLVPLPAPFTMVTAFGEAERLKLCATAFTVRLSVVVFVNVPDVPVTVTVTVPVAAVALAISVSVLVEVVGFGLNAAVTPVGKPDAERVALPLKPFTGVVVIVLVPLLPCVMVTPFGEGESVKFGVPFTVRLNVVV
jgi:hypothetical protein